MSVKEELISLTDDNGLINPRHVVEWAADHPESELYRHFEWDDQIAAESYRVWQARRLIAIYVVTDEGMRSTISLIQDRHSEGGYRDIDRVFSNAEMRQMALEQALRELRVWQQRYEYMQELAIIFSAADQVENRMRIPRPRFETPNHQEERI